MARTCWCYTTDHHYLVPTIVSALQARAHLDAGRADVVILYLGARDASAHRAALAPCAEGGVSIRSVDPGEVDGCAPYLMRHHLDRLLDPGYDDVVHVDGDTQVSGPLAPFLDAPLGAGDILAVRDPMALAIDGAGDDWARRRAYFASIGIAGDRMRDYVNTGIFRLPRTDLREVGAECRRLEERHRGTYAFTEQDAMNVAFGPRIRHASLRWNFPAYLAAHGVHGSVSPRVTHFMSNPRPWHGAFPPWGRKGAAPYADILARHPDLAPHLAGMNRGRVVKYHLQQRYKRVVERPLWKGAHFTARLREAERVAVV